MLPSELETFVKKFEQLWHSGLNAHLDLDTQAGNAWVGLRVQLGHAPGPLHDPFPSANERMTESPSRKRRRTRREAARNKKTDQVTLGEAEKATNEAAEKATNEDAEIATNEDAKKATNDVAERAKNSQNDDEIEIDVDTEEVENNKS